MMYSARAFGSLISRGSVARTQPRSVRLHRRDEAHERHVVGVRRVKSRVVGILDNLEYLHPIPYEGTSEGRAIFRCKCRAFKCGSHRYDRRFQVLVRVRGFEALQQLQCLPARIALVSPTPELGAFPAAIVKAQSKDTVTTRLIRREAVTIVIMT